MRDERGSAQRRRPGQPGERREVFGRPPARPSGPEPKLDVERAKAEIERFLDVALRDMNLDLEREITVTGPADDADNAGNVKQMPGAPEIAVRFRGPDEELLLERNAELLL